MGARGRSWRVWLLLAAGLLAALALGLAWAAARREALLEWVLLRALRERGVAQASLSVEAFEADGLALADVRIGEDALALRRLALTYTPSGLLDGRLGALRIEGLHVRGRLAEDGLSLGALDALRGGDAAAASGPPRFPALPTERLEVEDANVVLETGAGLYVAALDVAMEASGDAHVALTASALPGLETALGLAAEPFVVEGSLALRPERLSLVLDPAPFQIALARGHAAPPDAAPLRMVGTTPRFELSAAPGGLATARLAASGGELRLPDLAVALRGFSLEAQLDEESRLPRARLAVEALRDLREPARVAPLAFSGTLAPDDAALALDGRLTGLGGRLALAVSGRHDPAAASGRGRLALRDLRLGEGGVATRELSPAAPAALRGATGTLAAAGELTWDATGLSGHADVGLEDVSLQAPGALLERINAAMRLEGPWPPRTPPGQLVSMARLDFGLELTNGLVEYRLRPDGVIDVASARWQLAGGTLSTAGALDLAAPEQRFVLDVLGVDLAKLLALVNLDGLTGTGTLTGRLPIVRRGARIEIRGGVLEASEAGGWVRYAPQGKAAALGSAAGMALDDLLLALRSFRYETLRLSLDGEAHGEVSVGLSLHGANPDHRDGQPYEFNLNVDGQLADMVRQTDAAYRIPARIEEQLGEIAREAERTLER